MSELSQADRERVSMTVEMARGLASRLRTAAHLNERTGFVGQAYVQRARARLLDQAAATLVEEFQLPAPPLVLPLVPEPPPCAR